MFTIIEINKIKTLSDLTASGLAIGQERKIGQAHLTHVVVEPGSDGKLVLLAACPSLPAAQAIQLALASTLAVGMGGFLNPPI
jgi:hypothetical protein